MNSLKRAVLVSVISGFIVLTMAYPQAPNNLARFFLWNRQSSYDGFNFLQSGQSNRPCVPEQYYHRQRALNDRSPQTRRTFYLTYPTYAPNRPNMYHTTTAPYNSYGGYPCDQTTSYRPFWLDIANLFGFGISNNNLHEQPSNMDLNNVRPVYENNDHSNANQYQWRPGSTIVGGIPNRVNGYYQNTEKPRPQYL